MKRNKFLSLLGLSFVGSFFFLGRKKDNIFLLNECGDPVTPPVPIGPYYKDEKLNRANIAEEKKGMPIEYVFMVEDKNCKPIENAIVDIWQCDADGHYSDFEQEKTLNETWLRGFQKTGADGVCKFTSIFPGWYTGRITHVHGKIVVDGKERLITNFFFPKDIEDEVFKNPFYPKGPNPTTLSEDFELRVDKDSVRHDALVMKIKKAGDGKLTAISKITLV